MMDENTIIKFGKHKGERLGDIPHGYFMYLYDRGLIKGELKKYVEKTVPVLRTKYLSISSAKKNTK
jgi:uncharacterized protein (DUF3820 family)